MDGQRSDRKKLALAIQAHTIPQITRHQRRIEISLINQPDHYRPLFADLPVYIKIAKGKTKAGCIRYIVTAKTG